MGILGTTNHIEVNMFIVLAAIMNINATTAAKESFSSNSNDSNKGFEENLDS
jgi:hypothetical protein